MRPDAELSMALSLSKIRVRTKSPFFGVLMGHLKVDQVLDPNFWGGEPTAAVDGESLFLDKRFFLGLDPPERDFVLVHEVLHVALEHVWRRGGRHQLKWNVACDYVVNLVAEAAGFTVPGKFGIFLDQRYAKMTADEVYRLLPEPSAAYYLSGDVKDGDHGLSSTEVSRRKAIWKSARAQAKAAEKMYSQGSGSTLAELEVVVEESSADWRNILWRELSWDLSDFKEWDRRLIGDEVYVEAVEPEEKPHRVAMCIDTSGSMVSVLGKIVGDVKQIERMNPKLEIDLYWADAEVVGPLPFSEIDRPMGGGGTDFRPFFQKVEEFKYDRVVYVTDLMGTFPELPPKDCRTLWITCAGAPREVPFGEIARVLDY